MTQAILGWLSLFPATTVFMLLTTATWTWGIRINLFCCLDRFLSLHQQQLLAEFDLLLAVWGGVLEGHTGEDLVI